MERIVAHTHVRDLGLDENLRALKVRDGMVGQERAREAGSLVVQTHACKREEAQRQTVILPGTSRTGKTATAEAIYRELGARLNTSESTKRNSCTTRFPSLLFLPFSGFAEYICSLSTV